MWTKIKLKVCRPLLFNLIATLLVIQSFLVCVQCEEKTTQHSIDCTLFVNNSTYDLTPLQKTGNEFGFEAHIWTLSKSSEKGKIGQNDAVYVNICGALSDKIGDGCAINHTDSAVCVRYGDTNATHSIGEYNNKTTLTWNPFAKAIELVYYSNNSVVNITLYCREGDFESRPILLEQNRKSKRTTYLFEWGISYACPLAIRKGSDCIIRDENDVVVYNLTSLRRPHYYQLNTSKVNYYINICGAIGQINLCKNYGSCQVEEKSAKNLGLPNSDLIYEGGTLKLVYENGNVYNTKSGLKRKTEISFICKDESSKNASLDEKPVFVSENRETGTYLFKFETTAACRQKVQTIHCSYSNGSHIWDLTRLSYSGQQSSVAVTGARIYLVNVCRPVNNYQMMGRNRKCKTPAGVCALDFIGVSEPVNYGRPKDPPYMLSDGTIALHYTDGDICSFDKTRNFSSLIKFVCGDELGDPKLISGANSCDLVFEWKTIVACNALELLKEDNCTYRDTRTGLSVDISVLTHNKKFLHIVSDTQEYSVNICGNQKYFDDPECKDSAVCVRNHAGDNTFSYVSFGNLSSRTTKYDGSKLVFTYSNGSVCTKTQNYSTEIHFKCKPTASDGKMELVRLAHCTAVFEWETNVVCELEAHKHDCTLLTEKHFYDLRMLSSASHVWHVNGTDGDEYRINICHHLPRGENCGHTQSAACLCKSKLGCRFSLGDFSTAKLTHLEDDKLLLTYSNGTSQECPDDTKTEIVFKCGKRRGSLKFKTFKDCTYVFEWETSAACPVNDREVIKLDESDGYVYDQRLNRSFNVTSFFKQSFEVTDVNIFTHDVYNYTINLVNATFPNDKRCNNASVCQLKADKNGLIIFTRNIGSLRNYEFKLHGNEVTLVVTSSDEQKCGKNGMKNVTTHFILMCSDTMDVNQPQFLYESNDCDYIFQWSSKYLCFHNFIDGRISIISPTPSIDTSAGETRHSSLAVVIFVFLFLISLTFAAFVYFNKERRSNLSRRIHRMFGPGVTPSFQYSQLSTNDLLANSNHSEVAFITSGFSSFSPYSDTTTLKDIPTGGQQHMTVPYSIYDDSDVNLLT